VDLDPVQDRIASVREGDVIERQVAVDARRRDRVRLVVDLGLGVEHRGDLLHRSAGRLHLAVEVGELLQRLEDEVEEEDRRDERADRQRPLTEHASADPQHGDHCDDAEELDRREEDRVEVLRVGVRDTVCIVRLVELGEERALAVERLDHGHPGDRLGDLRSQPRDRFAHPQERRV
jgi:hypothetical protein